MTPSQRELVRKIFRTIVVLGLALICAVPLYYVIVSSFKTSIDMIKNPLGFRSSGRWRTTRRPSPTAPSFVRSSTR